MFRNLKTKNYQKFEEDYPHCGEIALQDFNFSANHDTPHTPNTTHTPHTPDTPHPTHTQKTPLLDYTSKSPSNNYTSRSVIHNVIELESDSEEELPVDSYQTRPAPVTYDDCDFHDLQLHHHPQKPMKIYSKFEKSPKQPKQHKQEQGTPLLSNSEKHSPRLSSNLQPQLSQASSWFSSLFKKTKPIPRSEPKPKPKPTPIYAERCYAPEIKKVQPIRIPKPSPRPQPIRVPRPIPTKVIVKRRTKVIVKKKTRVVYVHRSIY